MSRRKPSNFRRHKEGKTDYRKRLRLLKSGDTRFVVRKSLNQIITQFVDYDPKGDKVKCSAVSNELEQYDWPFTSSNIPSAYLTGYLSGSRAVSAGIKKAVFDMGLERPIPGSRFYAALKGAIDAGVKIPENEKAFPPEERIKGKHIEDYASKLKKDDSATYKERFSGYLDKDADPTKMTTQFDKAKEEIKNETSGSEGEE